jgi:hypothetical protein
MTAPYEPVEKRLSVTSDPPRGPTDKETIPHGKELISTICSPPPQIDRCRRFLERGWTCGLDFLNPADGYPPILRYSSRISELRRDGFYIDRRECENRLHDHPHSTMWQWRIVGHVSDGTLPGIGAP